MSVISFTAGSLTKDSSVPPTEDSQGLIFAADGTPHTAGVSSYIPLSFRAPSDPVTLTFLFYPGLAVAGSAHFTLQWITAPDSGAVIATGATSFDVAFTGAQIVHNATIDITNCFTDIDARLLLLIVSRDSSDPADTYASSAAFMTAYTNEI